MPVMTPEEVRQTVPLRLKYLGISVNLLAEYSGQTQAQLSRWINKKIHLGLEESRSVDRWLSILEQIQRKAYPLPVDFSNVDAVHMILKGIIEDQIAFEVRHPLASQSLGGYDALAGTAASSQIQ